jgi:hypothetical protein
MQDLYDSALETSSEFRARKEAVKDAEIDALVNSVLDRVPEMVKKAAAIGDTHVSFIIANPISTRLLEDLWNSGKLERALSPFTVHWVHDGARIVIKWN